MGAIRTPRSFRSRCRREGRANIVLILIDDAGSASSARSAAVCLRDDG